MDPFFKTIHTTIPQEVIRYLKITNFLQIRIQAIPKNVKSIMFQQCFSRELKNPVNLLIIS